MKINYGVFQINGDGFLVRKAFFDTKEEAISHVKLGTNMVILKVYI